MNLMRIVRGVTATFSPSSRPKGSSCALGCDCADKDEEDKCEDCKKSGMG